MVLSEITPVFEIPNLITSGGLPAEIEMQMSGKQMEMQKATHLETNFVALVQSLMMMFERRGHGHHFFVDGAFK